MDIKNELRALYDNVNETKHLALNLRTAFDKVAMISSCQTEFICVQNAIDYHEELNRVSWRDNVKHSFMQICTAIA